MNKKLALPVFIVIVLLFAAFLYYMTSPAKPTDSVTSAAGIEQNATTESIDQEVVSKGLDSAALSKDDVLNLKTFRLANVDGKLEQDAEGNLIINRDLRHWIDFYLSATGEVSLEDLIALMKREISLLDSPAKEQAMDILLSYLGYKTELSDYDEREALAIANMSTVEQVGSRIDWQKRLRREWLPTEAVDQFWQLDELIDDQAYQKMVINSSELSDEEKAQQIEILESELPKEVTDFRQALTLSKDLMEQERELIEQGRGDEIGKLRAEKVSPEAVKRLEAFDQQQAKWHSRVVDYRNQTQQIESMEGISNTRKQELINEYQEAHFDEREKLRLPGAVQLINAE